MYNYEHKYKYKCNLCIFVCMHIPVNTTGWFFRPVGEIQMLFDKRPYFVFFQLFLASC